VFHYKLTRIKYTVREDLKTFMVISHLILLRKIHFSYPKFIEKIKTYILLSIIYFWKFVPFFEIK